ncbi:BrnT family toxin [Azospirillum sp. sgz302134]
MEIAYDPAKDVANREKHGVSLVLGRVVLANRVGEEIDERDDYGELRRIAYGLIAGRLFVCVYTLRGTLCRIISVRKANRREQRRWLP